MSRLDEIEARANAATAGPWENANGQVLDVPTMTNDPDSDCWVADAGSASRGENAEFIAHARTDVPALVAALRAVLALSTRDLAESPDYEERIWDSGFNAALGDVRAAITSALGGAR